MRDAWQIGHLFGIPLRIHVSWLIVFGLVSWSLAAGYFPAQLPDLPVWSYWAKAIVAALMFFASLILHELGHSLVARRHGVDIASITLFVFGGVSEMREEPRTPRQEFQIAVIGPVISLALAGVFGLIGVLLRGDGAPTGTAVVVLYLATVNLLVGIFNLLPAFPLDGGRVLRAALWYFKGDLLTATRNAARVSSLLSLALIGLGLLQLFAGNFGGLWLAVIGWFIRQAGASAATQASLRQVLGGLRVRDVMTPDPKTVNARERVSELIEDYFARYNYGGYPVESGGNVVGIVTLRDLRKTPPEERSRTSVEQIMSPLTPDLVVAPEMPVLQALTRMLSTDVDRLVVLERGRRAGLVTSHGILRLAQVKTSFAA
jgi:Zn-dependent protease/predicted transcriptional regulator